MKKFGIIGVVLILSMLCGCEKDVITDVTPSQISTRAVTTVTEETVQTKTTTSLPVVTTTEPAPKTASVNIVCAGDNLIHSPVYTQAKYRSENGGYDFTYAYENVADLISEADLAILNQETIISDDYEPSNFPYFCSPTDLAHCMVDIGFDAVSVSNNHCLDKGEEGLASSLGFWKETYPEIPVYGAYLNKEDMNEIRTLEINGITFAFLGFMEHTNGLYLPENAQCQLTYMSETEEIERQIEAAGKIADCVIVSVHFGVEVSNTVTQQQYDFSRYLAEKGADIIIGTQPHTIQSMEYIEKENGEQAFVFYCLGNFISAMDKPHAMVEMLGRITVVKDFDTGKITLSDPNAVPLINHYDYRYQNLRVIPFSDYTKELAGKHGCAGVSYGYFEKIINENIPKEFLR